MTSVTDTAAGPGPAGSAQRAEQARRKVHRSRVVRVLGLVAAVVALVLVCLVSIWFGARDIPFSSTWDVLWHNDGSRDAAVIHTVRIPRTVLGLLVGTALGTAGALMQALTRNPLADPGLLGITWGSSAAIVGGIAFLGIGSVHGYVWLAFAGAAIASVVVYGLGSSGRGGATPDRLVMAGAAITAVLFALVNAVLLLNPLIFNEFRFWDAGSLTGRPMTVTTAVLPFIGAGVVLALALARPLNALSLGDHAAKSLGTNIGLTRVLGVAAVTLLCGAATAGAGPIGFIGLAVPHIARLIAGPDQRWVLPYSMVLAPVLLLGADVLGRLLTYPGELQVGVVTAFLGAPVFILLCRRRKVAKL